MRINEIENEPDLFWKAMVQYYRCASIKNLTTLTYSNGTGLNDESKRNFIEISLIYSIGLHS